ncbi:MAG: tyrosine phosphatase family protein [Alphaproteobacteria bacterium]
MTAIMVCPLSRLDETVSAARASHVVSLLGENGETIRPASVPRERHLSLQLNDISEAMEGHILPGSQHVRALVDFVDAWDQRQPMVIHCYAGISRSTAGAYIVLCHLNPNTSEVALATALRAASSTATPNRRLIALADDELVRDGRMVAAIADIGRGAMTYEGLPFSLSLRL